MRRGRILLQSRRPDPMQPISLFASTGVQADYIVVEIAKHVLGENWMAEYVAKANNGGIERVLL